MKDEASGSDLPLTKISFAAPEAVHGVIKQIVGWAEMNGVRVNGKSLTEKEFISGLIAEFWESGRENWESRIESNSKMLSQIAELGKGKSRERKKMKVY